MSVANSGRAALENLETFRPDSVLLDIGMPAIALTGWGQEHDHRRSRAAGFDHHLVKPPDIDKLRDLLSAGWPGAEHHHVRERRRSG